VFVGSWSGAFHAIDARTGREKWKVQTGVDPAYHNQQGFQGSPAVVNGVVYVGARDSHVYAFDAASGRKLWEYAVGGAWVSSSPAVRDGKVYVGTGDSGKLLVLDAATGRDVAQLSIGWMIFSSPAIAGNLMFVGTFDGEFVAVDLRTNRPVWTFQSDSSRINRPRYTGANGRIDFAGTLIAERFYDDFVVRVAKIFSMGSFMSSATIANGVVYVGSTDGNLYAFR
jgi:outer membrane protein assembly factor BamB